MITSYDDLYDDERRLRPAAQTAVQGSPEPPRGETARQPVEPGREAGCRAPSWLLAPAAVLASVAVALAALLGLLELLQLT